MSDTTTAGTWIRLPTALGADDRTRADQPGDAALFQILASNATLACRENELRPLWERGKIQVWADCTVSDDERTLRWSALESDGVLAQWAGVHRVRLYGEQQRPPQVVLAARGAVVGAYTLGIVVLVMPSFGAPDPLIASRATATTRSTTVVNLTATVDLTPEALGLRAIAPPATGSPSVVDETGEMTEVSIYVGAWCTSASGASKATLGGLSVYLIEPA
jgi:hypothetical protein